MIPILDMSKVWTDQSLYDYFNLSKSEIEYIEDTAASIGY